MFYLTTTAKRKNAKRHIVTRSNDLEELKRMMISMHKDYIAEIYDGRWNLIERRKEQ